MFVSADSSLTACSGVENAGTPQKLLILDARSYTAAVANRAKGGGCECEGTEGKAHPRTSPSWTRFVLKRSLGWVGLWEHIPNRAHSKSVIPDILVLVCEAFLETLPPCRAGLVL